MLISCAVTAQLIFAFGFAYRRSGIKTSYLRFSNFSGETKNLIIFDRCFQCLLNSKDGNEYSNIRIFVFLTNIRMRFRIRIFVFFMFIFFILLSLDFGLKFAFILASLSLLTHISVKVGTNHPCKLRCQFDTLLF